MNELYVNILFVLTRYFSFAKNFFRKNYIVVTIAFLSYMLYAYGFYLVEGYSASIILSLYALKSFNIVYKLYKNIIGKILFTILILLIIYFYEVINIIHFLPYISFILLMWTHKKIKNNKINMIIKLISDIMWMIYAYKYHVYVLFIYKVYISVFNIFGTGLKDIVKYTNKKTR